MEVVDTIAPFEIQVDRQSLERSSYGSITGVIFISFNRIAFPEGGWNDFPVVVLGWWLREITNLLSGSSQASCEFMDGDFRFQLEPKDEAWLLKASDGGQATPQEEVLVFPREVITSLLRASAGIEEECGLRRWASRDLDTLRERRMALAATVPRH
jgi:hypothetical protein